MKNRKSHDLIPLNIPAIAVPPPLPPPPPQDLHSPLRRRKKGIIANRQSKILRGDLIPQKFRDGNQMPFQSNDEVEER